MNNTDSVCRLRACDWSSHEGLAHFLCSTVPQIRANDFSLSPVPWQKAREEMLESPVLAGSKLCTAKIDKHRHAHLYDVCSPGEQITVFIPSCNFCFPLKLWLGVLKWLKEVWLRSLDFWVESTKSCSSVLIFNSVLFF